MNLLSATTLLLAVSALTPNARAGDGDAVSYKFSKPPVNSMGIAGMEDLRGKPIIIDFWGTH